MLLSSKKNNLTLHGGIGALFGTMLFIICFTGTWSLAKEELYNWWQPALAATYKQPLSLEQLISIAKDKGVSFSHINILLPQPYNPSISFCIPPNNCILTLNTMTGEQQLPTQALDTLITLHKTFYAGFIGRIIISLFGIVLCLLIISGLIIHSWRLRHFIKIRWRKGLHAFSYDCHSLLGLWALPWLILIAITGTISGLGALATIGLSSLAFPEKPQQAYIALMQPNFKKLSGTKSNAELMLTSLLVEDKAYQPNFIAQTISLQNWGDMSATVEIGGYSQGNISNALFERHLYQLHPPKRLKDISAAKQSLWVRAFIANQPLHFGQYQWAGEAYVPLRFFHFCMGVASCLLIISGLYLWSNRHQHATKSQWLLKHLSLGICGGLVVATGVLLLGHLFLPQDFNFSLLLASSWLIAALAPLLLFHQSSNKYCSLQLMLAGLCYTLASLLHLYTIRNPIQLKNIWYVDFTLFVIGILLILISYKINIPLSAINLNQTKQQTRVENYHA